MRNEKEIRDRLKAFQAQIRTIERENKPHDVVAFGARTRATELEWVLGEADD